MLNLIDKLSEEDKTKIETYIYNHSIVGSNYCGNDAFLAEWAKNKKTLFHLLGGKLMCSIPIQYDVTKCETGIYSVLGSHTFVRNYKCFIDSIPSMGESYGDYTAFYNLISKISLNNNALEKGYKKKINGKEHTLVLSEGMKLIKAINKVLSYFNEELEKFEEAKELQESYEDFQKQYSILINNNKINSKLTISIHPLDFLTMSNNNSRWSSCMRWDKEDAGVYHAGTVEMMNSNNVVCCYLESATPYSIGVNPATKEELFWNNKRWRMIAIVTPEIILQGKEYPFKHKPIVEEILKLISKLAKTNCGWRYKYGLSRYNDMKYINDGYTMDNNHLWIANGETTKQNIIMDTNLMYNDYLNNSTYEFYCYRNPVKKNTIINYSGKAICLCCGKDRGFRSSLTRDSVDEAYNERYGDMPETNICTDCSRNIKCFYCGEFFNDETLEHKKIAIYTGSNDTKTYICGECLTHEVGKCPECGNFFITSRSRTTEQHIEEGKCVSKIYFLPDPCPSESRWDDDLRYFNDNPYYHPCLCSECTNKKILSKYNFKLQKSESYNRFGYIGFKPLGVKPDMKYEVQAYTCDDISAEENKKIFAKYRGYNVKNSRPPIEKIIDAYEKNLISL